MILYLERLLVLLVVLPTTAGVETALRFWQRQIQYHTLITSIIVIFDHHLSLTTTAAYLGLKFGTSDL